MSSKRSRPAKKSLSSLYVSFTGVEPGYVPKRWVKFPVALLLLPPCWVLSLSFFTAMVSTTLNDFFWASPVFWFFAGGCAIAAILCEGFPKLVIAYVLGHELTHALWVWLHGGRVHDFRVTSEGGHIITDKTNTWVVLAPYFFPFYTAGWIVAYGLALLIPSVSAQSESLFFGIGLTWTFHMIYTVRMIKKGQPDIEYGGVFFSIVVIYFLNLVLISALLIVSSPSVTWTGFAGDLLENAMDFSAAVVRLVSRFR